MVCHTGVSRSRGGKYKHRHRARSARTLRTPGDGAFLFRSEDGSARQIVFAVPVETNKTGSHERLVFHRYGNEQFAAQVWFMGDAEGYELIPGAREKESAANRTVGDQMGAEQ